MQIAFRRIIRDLPYDDPPFTVVRLPLIPSASDGGRTASKNIEHMQSRMLFAMAAERVGIAHHGILDKAAAGDSADSLNRFRFFERLEKGEFRVAKALERREKRFLASLRAVRGLEDATRHMLSWSLWEYLEPTLGNWELARRAEDLAEDCGYEPPAPPRPDISDVARYVSELFPAGYHDEWNMLHMGIHCLNVAEATWNLAQYIVTYEALFNQFAILPFEECVVAALWIETLAHANRWFRTLEVSMTSHGTRRELATSLSTSLGPYGIHLRIAKSVGLEILHLERWYPTATSDRFPAISLPDSTEKIQYYL
ncbi:hypothetical protein [Paraburkholderia sp. C35]|uniref:hypothetical protein n=1 Tax=Paraburkholderia sp. C35 TaxID=2126993 RepID=UPI0013A589EC|nr:hypothetical protein [Paraburkholderia sp. C35]